MPNLENYGSVRYWPKRTLFEKWKVKNEKWKVKSILHQNKAFHDFHKKGAAPKCLTIEKSRLGHVTCFSLHFIVFSFKIFKLLFCHQSIGEDNTTYQFRLFSMDWFLYDNGLRHERVNKVASLSPTNLSKKRPWHRCFPVKFVKVLRIHFLQNNSGRLLLKLN